jgi:hypothetical protein
LPTRSRPGFEGIDASGNTKMLRGRSVTPRNSQGVTNGTSPNMFYTFGDNRISLNGDGACGPQDISSALNTSFTTH